ncbi:hypothetical protein ONZ51_g8993 [Trametes cubensis]|uniref:Uncharacterized protein n=1 Tax=Trametes cubensis TaxID=1111947 RepID=A0AAD7TML9_9APHY|nr:hypothetical protein ONZ51_g8993 [Trametes cubensis]
MHALQTSLVFFLPVPQSTPDVAPQKLLPGFETGCAGSPQYTVRVIGVYRPYGPLASGPPASIPPAVSSSSCPAAEMSNDNGSLQRSTLVESGQSETAHPARVYPRLRSCDATRYDTIILAAVLTQRATGVSSQAGRRRSVPYVKCSGEESSVSEEALSTCCCAGHRRSPRSKPHHGRGE